MITTVLVTGVDVTTLNTAINGVLTGVPGIVFWTVTMLDTHSNGSLAASVSYK